MNQKGPDVNPAHLRCRIYGHDWDAVGDIVFTTEGYWETLLCDRCGVRRTALIERGTGYVKRRRYNYPKGYQIKGGVTRQELGKIRLQVMKDGGFKS
ncbi:hypothetical protein PBI_WOES_79 [Gordonia phage Woes]|uniref:Uncharacterized protein n=8 Tax=Woesvirus woes TaxID=1982751 RepID=A0A482JGK7_9CAUD|nr:hypothetical protein BH793_gp34 [Gordonia phage Woes]ATW61174.1 hypothetical protein SEA_ANAMIKA_79 [Gordonia phage Anamika]AVP43263.1 hypothetical protein PBI_HAIL2PITT_78 [Gordonia phage Hail2Pitt]QAX94362.1 hypothetical protein SEA_GUILLAUME_79 [Gordonia phage Guillaume]QAX94685.1 hypothetical protein SEA_HARAMBE_79 [Gordonia phage Harambe]QBP30356.1 hypothetical protein SEA_JORMUNGANDR_79 [Gordonia phage Jormungandr]QBP30652.1 hypothetical protein SEA_LAHIRIUM_80 [Gordonia phage Lahiri